LARWWPWSEQGGEGSGLPTLDRQADATFLPIRIRPARSSWPIHGSPGSAPGSPGSAPPRRVMRGVRSCRYDPREWQPSGRGRAPYGACRRSCRTGRWCNDAVKPELEGAVCVAAATLMTLFGASAKPGASGLAGLLEAHPDMSLLLRGECIAELDPRRTRAVSRLRYGRPGGSTDRRGSGVGVSGPADVQPCLCQSSS
jgi:hypothetical protein